MPHLGATGGDVKIVEWLVAESDLVVAGAVLLRRDRQVDRRGRGFSRRPLVGPLAVAGSSQSRPARSSATSATIRLVRRWPRLHDQHWKRSRGRVCLPPSRLHRRPRPGPRARVAVRLSRAQRREEWGGVRRAAGRGLRNDGADPPLRRAPLPALPPGIGAGHAASVPGPGGSRGRRLLSAAPRRSRLFDPPAGRALDRQGRLTRCDHR